jgi:hypothetical protein
MKKTILAIILAGSSAAVCAQDTSNMNNNRMDSAQNTTGVQTSTGDYNAYANMPPSIQRNFQAQYPGVTNAQWQPTYNGLWRASYMQNGQWMNVNYSPRGESFMVALPVLQSSVPAEIVSKAMDLYGGNVYDISLVKLPNPQLAAMDSMIAAASSNAVNNTGITTTDTAAMDNTTGDTTTTVPSGVTSYPPNTFWGVDTTGRAAMPRTIDLYLVRIIDNGMLRAQRMNADGSPDLSYGTTMASPMPSNVNMNNNMNQNLTTTNVSTMSMPTTFSAYYGTGTTGVSTDVNTNAYPAKDSAANTTVDTTAATVDTSAAAPITDTTSRAVTDTTSANPITDTTSREVTDTTSNSSSVNPTGDMNSNNTQVQTESGNVSTSTSTDMNNNNNTNTNKKNKKNKKNKNSTDSSNGTTTPSGTSGY